MRGASQVVLVVENPSAKAADAGEDWKEKIQSEKIAFLTTEIGLTPEEAQAFWPVYNQALIKTSYLKNLPIWACLVCQW